MTQTIYALSSDNGDGSASVVWFKQALDWDSFIATNYTRWGANEGEPQSYTFPEGLDLEAAGFGFYYPNDDDK